MKQTLLFLVIILTSCVEKPKPKSIDAIDVSYKIGKSFRMVKDAYKKGYSDTTQITKDSL